MQKKRNGLLEIYRLLFCFWVMFYHDFFFFENTRDVFQGAPLAVDFFFILSGFFLIRSMRELKGEPTLLGAAKLVFSRMKPLLFSVIFITSFNAVCTLLFIHEDYLDVIFCVIKYWWYLLYLFIATGLLYIVYRLMKSEKAFCVFLFVLMISMTVFHYAVEERGFLIYEFTYVARTFAPLSFGMLISFIPRLKGKWVFLSSVIVFALVVLLFCLAYGEKKYLICLAMVCLFGVLIYFTSTIPVSGRIFDLIGKLSTRMYLYMSFVSMLHVLGLKQHRVLFVIAVFLAVIDLFVTCYRKKYLALKSVS